MKPFLLFLFLYGLYPSFQPVSHVASSGHSALGHVLYEQFTYAHCDQYLNGPASLWFNDYEAVYVHDGILEKSAIDERGTTLVLTPGDEEGFPVYLNLKTNELIYKGIVGLYPEPFIIHDLPPKIDWRILDEYREIGGYSCQKAEGEFAGRLYEAWFAKDIPIPFGPYKLWGLPGLILEAKSDNGDVRFLFKSLELSEEFDDQVFVPCKGRGHFYSYSEYVEARRAFKENLMRESRAEGSGVTVEDAPWDCKIEIRE